MRKTTVKNVYSWMLQFQRWKNTLYGINGRLYIEEENITELVYLAI